ncbi:hypothetical protein [Zestomonas carbonaria]|uniref:Uncharacterized protein n=1 Tax=Zestomonas carbonaria TaxID=2762745 RepID=A0A7U7IBS6_9GAMM|nr:hypothetical protein [Pseudomonas carbonaria]CAD5109272.1 hypothetical protein PSEWESI4_03568 [Pseudomonas carbonaria]
MKRSRSTSTHLRNGLRAAVLGMAGLMSIGAWSSDGGGGPDSSPPGVGKSMPTTYSFASLDGLIAFLDASPQARLQVFAWIPASVASGQEDAVRLLDTAMDGPRLAQQEPAETIVLGTRYADMRSALESIAVEDGYPLLWGAGANKEAESLDELVGYSRSLPPWVYIYSPGEDAGVPRLINQGRISLLDQPIGSKSRGGASQ